MRASAGAIAPCRKQHDPRRLDRVAEADQGVVQPRRAVEALDLVEQVAQFTIRPIHAPFDGDVVFALSTARRLLVDGDFTVGRIGALAADTLARAVARAVYAATAWPQSEVRCWRDL